MSTRTQEKDSKTLWFPLIPSTWTEVARKPNKILQKIGVQGPKDSQRLNEDPKQPISDSKSPTIFQSVQTINECFPIGLTGLTTSSPGRRRVELPTYPKTRVLFLWSWQPLETSLVFITRIRRPMKHSRRIRFFPAFLHPGTAIRAANIKRGLASGVATPDREQRVLEYNRGSKAARVE